MRIALFPGSFDPFTLGHADLVERALPLFDKLVIGVGYNEHKNGWISVDERVRALRELYADCPQVEVACYSSLTVDFAREVHAGYLLRGVRSHADYEYELNIADVNRQLTGIETVVLFANPQLAAVSSSVVRELAHFGKDITPWLPRGLNYKR